MPSGFGKPQTILASGYRHNTDHSRCRWTAWLSRRHAPVRRSCWRGLRLLSGPCTILHWKWAVISCRKRRAAYEPVAVLIALRRLRHTVCGEEHPINKLNRFSTSRRMMFALCSAGNDRESPIGTAEDAKFEGLFWCCRKGLNFRPLPYQGSALPLGRPPNAHRGGFPAKRPPRRPRLKRPGAQALVEHGEIEAATDSMKSNA
jgi:hypothetical protein